MTWGEELNSLGNPGDERVKLAYDKKETVQGVSIILQALSPVFLRCIWHTLFCKKK
jgi:hypothetical protein